MAGTVTNIAKACCFGLVWMGLDEFGWANWALSRSHRQPYLPDSPARCSSPMMYQGPWCSTTLRIHVRDSYIGWTPVQGTWCWPRPHTAALPWWSSPGRRSPSPWSCCSGIQFLNMTLLTIFFSLL